MKKYFILKGKKKLGPLNYEELKAHTITKDTLVWKEGMGNWLPASELTELNDITIGKPPEIPNEFRKQFKSQTRYYIKYIISCLLIAIFVGLILGFASFITNGGFEARKELNDSRQLALERSKEFQEYLDRKIADELNSSATNKNEEDNGALQRKSVLSQFSDDAEPPAIKSPAYTASEAVPYNISDPFHIEANTADYKSIISEAISIFYSSSLISLVVLLLFKPFLKGIRWLIRKN